MLKIFQPIRKIAQRWFGHLEPLVRLRHRIREKIAFRRLKRWAENMTVDKYKKLYDEIKDDEHFVTIIDPKDLENRSAT